MDRAGMLKVMHEVFGFVPVVMPWISAAGFLLLKPAVLAGTRSGCHCRDC